MRGGATWVAASLGLTFAVGTTSQAFGGEGDVPAGIAGTWSGDARIIVRWCHQTSLPVAVTIHVNGAVTGKVGDATLVEAHFRRNRGWLGRKLNVKTDYIITGKLNGPIIANEEITRSRVSIPIHLERDNIAGGLHTSGLFCGGKKHMTLSAAHLTLARTNQLEGNR